MARKQVHVTLDGVDTAKIPDDLVQAGVVFADLEARGVVQEAGERLKVRRQGGYTAMDLWLTVLMYLTTGTGQGFKKFWKHVQPHQRELAAVAGRSSLPSPSAVSRGLGAMEFELVREATGWMLTEAPAMDAVLRHPAVLTYDAQGEGWHVVDLDPTVTALRHRKLPVGDDLPPPVRRSEDTGAPGYSGRKRGDIQFRRTDVQHAGSGLWIHAHLHRGNGQGVAGPDLALGHVTGLLDRLDHPLDRAVVRMDGEHGTVPYLSTCRAHGLPFLVRLNRSALYDDPAVLEQLRTATWYQVPDSGCGPTRAAADLGVLTLPAGERTRRPDGGRYEPIDVRVVASIMPGDAGRGRVIDGWQVELFAADLPADAWPAPEAVAAYFGRSGQENRLAQEDRELGLDRILTYHLPGQEFATLTGLFLLNYRIARGFDLETPPEVRPAPELRRPVVDERVPAAWPADPVVTSLLDELDWASVLAHRPRWRWDADDHVLYCPDGRPMALTTVRSAAPEAERTGLIFCRPTHGCEACDVRDTCFSSERPGAAKHAEFSVPTPIATALRERLAVLRADRPTTGFDLEPLEADAGLHAVLTARFLPVQARRRFEEVFEHARLQVYVDDPEPPTYGPRLVADSDADRQHRRQTWTERNAYNRLHDEAVVRLEVTGKADLAFLIRPTRPEAEPRSAPGHG